MITVTPRPQPTRRLAIEYATERATGTNSRALAARLRYEQALRTQRATSDHLLTELVARACEADCVATLAICETQSCCQMARDCVATMIAEFLRQQEPRSLTLRNGSTIRFRWHLRDTSADSLRGLRVDSLLAIGSHLWHQELVSTLAPSVTGWYGFLDDGGGG